MADNFYWTNRKFRLQRHLHVTQRIMVRLYDIADGLTELQAAIKGVSVGGHEYITEYHEIGKVFDGLEAYGKGKFIQDSLPFMSPADREFIKTATAPQDLGERS